jgi:hypothetical protein
MINGWLRHIELTAKAKTGASSPVVLLGALAAVALLAALVFFSIAAFIWLAGVYGELDAAMMLTGFYAVIAIVCIVSLVFVRRSTIARANRALGARTSAALIDPALLAVGLEIGKALGWKKTLPIAAIGIVAAGIAREWSSPQTGDGES